MLGITKIAHFTTQMLAAPVRHGSFHLIIGDGVISGIERKLNYGPAYDPAPIFDFDWLYLLTSVNHPLAFISKNERKKKRLHIS